MINLCTLFDSNYLSRGLALYESLCKQSSAFHLYVVCFNDDCYAYLSDAALPNIIPVALQDFEDEKLLQVKPTRSVAEYCWTCTPSVILYCLTKFELQSCTYIDADMIFYNDPKILLDEMQDASVLISEHRYTKEYEQSAISGKYCVQFMCFRNNIEGMSALHWWRERCLEWCYARVEDGKFGDQKYLDDWTVRFKGVHVMKHLGGGVAPWNIQQYFLKADPVTVVERKSGNHFPLIFYHFHGLKFFTDEFVSCSGPVYDLTFEVKKILYIPYIEKLLDIERELNKENITFNVSGAKTNAPAKWQVFLEYIKERLILWKVGNISAMNLKLLRFTRHYHYFNLKTIKNQWPD
jgi:hypothetical protein